MKKYSQFRSWFFSVLLSFFCPAILHAAFNDSSEKNCAELEEKKLLSYSSPDNHFSWDATIFFQAGYTNNRALYSSFGFERQIFRVNELVMNNNFTFSLKNDSDLYFVVEFAPYYNSIKKVYGGFFDYATVGLPSKCYGTIINVKPSNPPLIGTHVNDFVINGASEYQDWYRNQGDRLYYVGKDMPFLELYVGWESPSKHHLLKIGRVKNALSFDDEEMIWKQNAWFAPYQYWLSKDLYTGVTYRYSADFGLSITGEILNGDGNPVKNNCAYIYDTGTPNNKSNNTPLLGLDIRFQKRFRDRAQLLIFSGIERTTIGSTWHNGQYKSFKEGKSNKTTIACGGEFRYIFNSCPDKYIGLVFQYTSFLSGLKEKSGQAHSVETAFPGLLKDIYQRGFFIGLNVCLDFLEAGVSYELFDRYDYRCQRLQYIGRTIPTNQGAGEITTTYFLNDYRNSKLHTIDINCLARVNKHIAIRAGYNIVRNPLEFVSNILPAKGGNRAMVALEFTL